MTKMNKDHPLKMAVCSLSLAILIVKYRSVFLKAGPYLAFYLNLIRGSVILAINVMKTKSAYVNYLTSLAHTLNSLPSRPAENTCVIFGKNL